MQIQEGEGWRLAVIPSRQPFSVLIGGADWAVELSLSEARALRDGLQRLQTQHESLRDQLMAEEELDLEIDRPLTDSDTGFREGGTLWLGLQSQRQGWTLRFVLSPADGQRAVEGQWPPPAALAFALALTGHPLLAAGSTGN